ncbi:phosphonate C-P lyase system protein PhnH [Devosia sediminis]|uniref:Phosphonate C-P lyase system protein PhnH n=1 Tax=Devosia sediminis TaxID=2798801 RepID=A0A934MKW4_9HYPH|nr:phosphonate C-P lyase system protein PhnH [Devosia sediminis]MBJ3784530.1 phosphonate C-P lyase system protein PhnH [Devosia sediminis]
MLTVAPPDAVELRANATFEALMWSLSRPGDVRTLPEAGFGAIVETLVDLECAAYADTPEMRARIVASGAMLAEKVSAADHVFLSELDSADIAELNCGSALYPDDGATLVLACAHQGQRLRLTGPGINGSKDVTLAVSPGFWAMRDMLCIYPEGFDIFFVDGTSVIGIPRSTKVEVL